MTQIKDCFTSRHEDGVIIEVDYSQLEVIGAALISGDMNMHEDIHNGIDSHSQSASWLNPYTYEEILQGHLDGDPFFEKMRKNAKGPRFSLQYGAGAKSIARDNDISIKVAQGFIDEYYGRYWRLKEYQLEVAEEVKRDKFKTGKHTPQGYPIHGGIYRSITGRSYYFEEKPAEEWDIRKGIYTSFTPTKFKNFPMQGFATGDVVPEMLGRVNRKLLHLTKPMRPDTRPLLINTVHDSMFFDCKGSHQAGVLKVVDGVLSKTTDFIEERWGITTDLPFKVEYSSGKSWGELKKVVVI